MPNAFALLISVFAALSSAKPAPVPKEVLNGGEHWKVKTDSGVIHVWRPKGYDARTAGVVIYVHGYFTDAETSWTKHKLVDQFEDSGKNALFIVPEAPVSSDEEVAWPQLGDLLRAVTIGTGIAMPKGSISVAAHSGAYRTIVGWLDYPPLRHIILLDALYGNEEDFLAWLEESRGHGGRKLTIVANDTVKWADPFVKRLPYAQSAPKLPDTFEALPTLQRDARVLYLKSQVGHMEIITGGRVVPVVLQRLTLKNVKPVMARSSQAERPDRRVAQGSP